MNLHGVQGLVNARLSHTLRQEGRMTAVATGPFDVAAICLWRQDLIDWRHRQMADPRMGFDRTSRRRLSRRRYASMEVSLR